MTAHWLTPAGLHTASPRLPDEGGLPSLDGATGWLNSAPWTAGKEAATADVAGGRIAYRFQARDLHLVVGPAAAGTPVRYRVLLDGRPAGPAHGVDEGLGTVTESRLYQLIRQPGPVAAHLRDHVPRPRRTGVSLHVRLDHGAGELPQRRRADGHLAQFPRSKSLG